MADYRGHGERILVVDDEALQRAIACDLLTKLGYHAAAVAGGKEAVEYVKRHPVDLLVLDMVMPADLTGLETYRQVSRIRPGQKAIITSGFAESEDVLKAQRLGAGPFIKKPYTLERIGLVVQAELKKQGTTHPV